ncbi:MAG: c-type cytochrome biogenesis protein CcsB [Desulfococcus sp. 4484_241]|nr:MAG: c-type cytochrome biogenesis protein CcsB [Desulfococcus sp. 4484_241]
MPGMIDLTSFAALFFYTLSGAAYLVYLLAQREKVHLYGYFLLLAGFICHAVFLCGQAVMLGHLPAFTLSHNLSLAACSTAGVFLLLNRRMNLKFFGVYAVPIILAITLVSVMLPEGAPYRGGGTDIKRIADSAWLITHVITMFAANGAFALACGAGIFYLVQEHAIKNKKRGFFYKRLPPLELLDSAGYSCIVAGFAMLTLGLVTGAVYAELVWGAFWRWDPKEVWSGITWLVYAALLHERLVAGWRGRRAAIMSIAGFFIVVFTFLGVNLLLGGHHGVFTRV